MRFSSFLPMLLLVGALHAQNQCSIFDLTATTTVPSPNACQYFVELDFEHSGTTNQFTVTGNGVNYGTFTYDQLPLKLGPFTADSIPMVKEFVVTDAVFTDCQDDTEVLSPTCSSSIACDIYNLTVVTGDCNPGGLTYQLTLDFEVTNPGNDFFEVWAGNGLYLGIFPLNALPLTIPVFPWDGDPTDQLKVCINDNLNCCEGIDFPAPACILQPCGISGLTATRGDCTGDSSYQVVLNFGLNTPTIIPAFGVWANDEFFGVFSFNDLPLTIDSFPWDGGPTDEIRVCIINVPTDPLNSIICCATAEIEVPDCLPIYPCGINGLSVETDTCSSDSTFGVWVNFTVNDSTMVDSFQLWGNGDDFGTFGLDQLPLYIADFPWNGGIFSYIKVCTGNTPTCCKEYQFLAPDCLPFGPCEVTSIAVQTGVCNADSTYKVYLNFQATNPGDGTFIVWANGALVDTFPLTAVPLTLDSFPWGGDSTDVVKICISNTDTVPCCREEAFQAPSCFFPDSCAITNVVIDPGGCSPDGQSYSLYLDFDVTDPGNDFFEVWANNGQYLGIFPLSQLPITIPEFPCTNSGIGVLKICINDNPNCCVIEEFQAPNCCTGTDPCEITNLTVETGDCTSDNTYEVWVNFDVTNPLGDEYGVWANGQFLGSFPLDSLPLYIPDFPWNGGLNDVVKVCLMSDSTSMVGCCKTKEFSVPDCLDQPCEIYNLTVETGACTSDSTYTVTINFQVDNPPTDIFSLWANGTLYGTFDLNQLPLTISDFPWDGGANDVVKVCMGDANDPNAQFTCCRTKEFHVPGCLKCEVYDLTVETGDCTSNSTYEVWIDFEVANPPSNTFELWVNGNLYGSFNVDSLPLYIPDFPWDGGSNDVVKVCFSNNNGAIGCCRTKEFAVPDCLDPGGPCHISDVTVETGDCTGDSTYTVTINFQVDNPPSDSFGLWANGNFFGTYNLNDLPLTITDFPWDGGPIDHVKVCFFNDLNPPGQPFCCHTKPFHVPDCLDPGGPCEIYDLTVETGDCTGDSTYTVTVNFQVDNPPSDSFDLWANGNFFGTYSLNDLPLTITDFPWDGGSNDVVKVCLGNTNTNSCCRTKEFHVPDCLDPGGPCEIYDLVVDTGGCTGDSTYTVTINFQVDNPPSNTFGVWANGQFLGNFNLDSLPLTITDFPWDGGPNDVVKVCFPSNTGAITCCKTKEFAVPDCIGQGPCHIFDLQVLHTPCLCGEFFAILTFEHENGGAEGFDIVGNGNNYGNFPYNTPQPIILGPFPGNGTTEYEFAVVDHLNPDCADGFNLGTVDCMTPVINPGDDGKLVLSPNPAANWMNVAAQFGNGSTIGEATVQIYHADGRLVRTVTVANGNNFQLDVADLPAGIYRLTLIAAAGRMEGTFARQ